MKFRKNYMSTKSWYKPTLNTEPSMVQKEHADELEINNVMARYVKTGFLPLKNIAPMFGDFSIPVDFEAAQDKILKARQMFIDLPYDVRDEFRTAEELIKAFQSPKGRARLERLGVLEKAPDAKQEDPAAKRGQPPVTSESASVPAAEKPPAS